MNNMKAFVDNQLQLNVDYNETLNADLVVTYPEERDVEEIEFRKNVERDALGKKNNSSKLALKQKHFQTKPTVTHRRINMGRR
jgi:hypothetical protein